MNLHFAATIALCTFAAACSAPDRNPTGERTDQTLLTECSREMIAGSENRLEKYGYDTMDGATPWPQDGSARRAEAVRIASRWALDNCYMPCPDDFKMCGLPFKTKDGDVYVYMAPSGDGPEDGPGEIVPEAQILLRGEELEIVEAIAFHRGCKAFGPERNGCPTGQIVPVDSGA